MSIMIFVMTKIIMMTGMPFKFYSLLCFCNYHLTLFRPFCQSPNNLGKDGTDNPTSEIVDWFWLEIVNRIWLGLKIAAGSDILSCNTAITSIWQSEIVLLTQHGLHVLQIQNDKYTNTSGVCIWQSDIWNCTCESISLLGRNHLLRAIQVHSNTDTWMHQLTHEYIWLYIKL